MKTRLLKIVNVYTLRIKIPKAELQKYSNYIKNIASSKVSALKNVADDAGSAEYIATSIQRVQECIREQ